MIPKVVHYCWLSNDPLPTHIQECIDSWKKHMPDWTIKRWDKQNFDIHSVPFVEQACLAKKWAFAADYIRLYALYNEGGVYLDSDVFVFQNMDFALKNRAFSAVEYYPDLAAQLLAQGSIDAQGKKQNPQDRLHGIQLQAAILGSEKGHPFFKDCLSYYSSKQFCVGQNGIPDEREISPIIMAGIAENYGFRYINIEQHLSEDFVVYSSEVFASMPVLMKPNAVAVHCCKGSWRTNSSPIRKIRLIANIYKNRIYRFLGIHKDRRLETVLNRRCNIS